MNINLFRYLIQQIFSHDIGQLLMNLRTHFAMESAVYHFGRF